MNIVLNEREFAIDALQRCVLGAKPSETLGRVAKYYHSEGYDKAAIHSKLEDFIVKCDPALNLAKWQTTIDNQVKSAGKFPLIEIDGVPITQKELDTCERVEGTQMKRLLFTLICLAKLGDATKESNNGWVNRPDKEIFKLANVVTSVKRQSLMYNDLRAAGFIRFSKKVDSVSINVLCIDNSGAPVLTITDFRNLGYQFLRYCGEPYIECACCGLVIKRTGSNHKYCSSCSLDIHRERARENFRKQALPQ